MIESTQLRADTPTGEVSLRVRAGEQGPIEELVVNGAFAMDSVDVTSELALADCVAVAGRRILVGGLGLGYTTARLCDRGAAAITVVEQAAPLVSWARGGCTPTLARVAADPRVALRVGRIQDVLVESTREGVAADGAPSACWDVILLDVDNGPTFLILDENADLYRDGLSDAWGCLADGGDLVIWCEAPSTDLSERLRALAGEVVVHTVPVAREGREFEYVLYRVRRPGEAGHTEPVIDERE